MFVFTLVIKYGDPARRRQTIFHLGSRELSVHVKDKDGKDKQNTHDENGHGADLESGRIVSVEFPHSSGVCRWTGRRAG